MLMIKIKNKKSSFVWTVVKLISVVALVLIVANIIRDKLSGSGKETSNLIGDVEDTDRDGIPNYYDECDCDEGIEKDPHNGCPATGLYKDGYGQVRNNECESLKGTAV